MRSDADARALADFQRRFAIRGDDDAPRVVARARTSLAALAALAPGAAPFDPAAEVAWLLLDDAVLAPATADDADDAELLHRLRLFMALAPDRQAWLDHLAAFPAGATAEARVRRVRKARLMHGAVHPDDATLAAPGPLAPFVAQHLYGPSVCLDCRRRAAPSVPVRVAAASREPLLEVRLGTRDALARARDVTLSIFADDGWMRARLDPEAPGELLAGRWRLDVYADADRFTAVVELPAQQWHGANLGPLPSRGWPELHRVDLQPLEDAGA